MSRKLHAVVAALALAPGIGLALSQGDGPPKGAPGPDHARMEKRMRLARTLGLAEALDLDAAQALKLGDTLNRFDERRKAIHKQAADARDVLRRAAAEEKASAAEVDGAIARLVEARAQAAALDKEALAAITQGLSPDRKARATLFLARFRDRIERHVFMGGPGGPGPGPGMMHGPGMPGRQGARGGDEQGMAGPGGVDRWGARSPDEDDDD